MFTLGQKIEITKRKNLGSISKEPRGRFIANRVVVETMINEYYLLKKIIMVKLLKKGILTRIIWMGLILPTSYRLL